MRVRSSLKWVLVVMALAYATSPAEAQPGNAAAPPATGAPASGAPGGPAAGSPGTGAGGTADGQVGFQRKTQLTPQEQLAEANKHVSRMEGSAAGIRKMLEEARKQRDVVKTLCLNDKLSQIDVAVRSARDRRQQLQSAVGRNDSELSNHEFTILTVLRQRSEQIVAEANQCIGEEAAFVGDTRTRVTVDPEIPPDETPYPSTDPSLVIGPPLCASCTL